MRVLVALALLLFNGLPAAAQQSSDWNTPRALELVDRARVRREQPHADTALTNYRADAAGYVYFYLDRRDEEERTLVKVDQIALEVYWAAPNRTKQRIVGLRDESRLPNRMHYHLDHLTVVQDEFGDVIRLGDGDEVRDVPHPASAAGTTIYDYRLSDSLTINLPGTRGPVRVYEIEVRPRDRGRPAFVGSLFVDRGTADIVRMTFTFTPASYVDRRLDYIHISLDNGLWDGQYWLPHEQRVEIRRQLPELDFIAGGVIKGVLRVGGYRFNEPLPENLFRGRSVVALPPAVLEQHPFEAGLYEGLAEEGLAPPPEMADLRRQAAQLIGARYLSGLPRLRPHVPGASSVFRYNRSEGLFLGGGVSYALRDPARIELAGGYAFGAEHASLRGSVTRLPIARHALRADAYLNEPRDVGPLPATAGVLNSIAALYGNDWTDTYFASGARLGLSRDVSAWRIGGSLGYEAHEAPRELVDPPFGEPAELRPLPPIDDVNLSILHLEAERATSATRTLSLGTRVAARLGVAGRERADALDVVRKTTETFARADASLDLRYQPGARHRSFALQLDAGIADPDAPQQWHYLLGGRGTLPGYAFRGFHGTRYALLRAEAQQEVVAPWLALRAIAAVGVTGCAERALACAAPTDGPRASAGIGVSALYDILRLELARGLNRGGEWEFYVAVRPDLWDIL